MRMISESEFKEEEVSYFVEYDTMMKEFLVEKISDIIEEDYMNEILPNYELQDEKSTKDIMEVYINLFWGITAIISTLSWLFFFIDRFLRYKAFRYFI